STCKANDRTVDNDRRRIAGKSVDAIARPYGRGLPKAYCRQKIPSGLLHDAGERCAAGGAGNQIRQMGRCRILEAATNCGLRLRDWDALVGCVQSHWSVA